MDLLGTEAGSLLLVDEESGELFFKVVLGTRASEVERARLKPGEGIAGWVVAHGYPDELAGDDIPPIARIIAVADTYDAITSDRPYRFRLDKTCGLIL